MPGYTYEDHGDGAAQEELLDESDRPAGHPKHNGQLDPYAFERPLDAVNRVCAVCSPRGCPNAVASARHFARADHITPTRLVLVSSTRACWTSRRLLRTCETLAGCHGCRRA